MLYPVVRVLPRYHRRGTRLGGEPTARLKLLHFLGHLFSVSRASSLSTNVHKAVILTPWFIFALTSRERSHHSDMEPLNIFLTTWNTGLQGSKAQAQDLTSWLLPVLHQTANDPEVPQGVIPDIYAIAVQELLPVHLACEHDWDGGDHRGSNTLTLCVIVAGLTASVLFALTERIQSLLSAHATSLAPGKTPEKYRLAARSSYCGNALWIFVRESTLGNRIGKPLTANVGLWWLGMGNKNAVGVRLPVKRTKEGAWEVLT